MSKALELRNPTRLHKRAGIRERQFCPPQDRTFPARSAESRVGIRPHGTLSARSMIQRRNSVSDTGQTASQAANIRIEG